MRFFMAKIKGDKKTQGPHGKESRFGMGDYYGTGIRNPIGKMRSDSVGYRPVSKLALRTPPKSVV